MALIVTGAGGATWRGADWVARNAFAFLVPALAAGGAGALAERIREELGNDAASIDLRELLDDERASARWTRALDAALLAIRAEGAAAWNEPARYEVFVALCRALGTLGRRDGNALVLELAETLRPQIDTETP